MKNSEKLDKNGFLKKKEDNWYKLAFVCLGLTSLVAIPAYTIARVLDNNIIQTIAACSGIGLFVAGTAGARVGDVYMAKRIGERMREEQTNTSDDVEFEENIWED